MANDGKTIHSMPVKRSSRESTPRRFRRSDGDSSKQNQQKTSKKSGRSDEDAGFASSSEAGQSVNSYYSNASEESSEKFYTKARARRRDRYSRRREMSPSSGSTKYSNYVIMLMCLWVTYYVSTSFDTQALSGLMSSAEAGDNVESQDEAAIVSNRLEAAAAKEEEEEDADYEEDDEGEDDEELSEKISKDKSEEEGKGAHLWEGLLAAEGKKSSSSSELEVETEDEHSEQKAELGRMGSAALNQETEEKSLPAQTTNDMEASFQATITADTVKMGASAKEEDDSRSITKNIPSNNLQGSIDASGLMDLLKQASSGGGQTQSEDATLLLLQQLQKQAGGQSILANLMQSNDSPASAKTQGNPLTQDEPEAMGEGILYTAGTQNQKEMVEPQGTGAIAASVGSYKSSSLSDETAFSAGQLPGSLPTTIMSQTSDEVMLDTNPTTMDSSVTDLATGQEQQLKDDPTALLQQQQAQTLSSRQSQYATLSQQQQQQQPSMEENQLLTQSELPQNLLGEAMSGEAMSGQEQETNLPSENDILLTASTMTSDNEKTLKMMMGESLAEEDSNVPASFNTMMGDSLGESNTISEELELNTLGTGGNTVMGENTAMTPTMGMYGSNGFEEEQTMSSLQTAQTTGQMGGLNAEQGVSQSISESYDMGQSQNEALRSTGAVAEANFMQSGGGTDGRNAPAMNNGLSTKDTMQVDTELDSRATLASSSLQEGPHKMLPDAKQLSNNLAVPSTENGIDGAVGETPGFSSQLPRSGTQIGSMTSGQSTLPNESGTDLRAGSASQQLSGMQDQGSGMAFQGMNEESPALSYTTKGMTSRDEESSALGTVGTSTLIQPQTSGKASGDLGTLRSGSSSGSPNTLTTMQSKTSGNGALMMNNLGLANDNMAAPTGSSGLNPGLPIATGMMPASGSTQTLNENTMALASPNNMGHTMGSSSATSLSSAAALGQQTINQGVALTPVASQTYNVAGNRRRRLNENNLRGSAALSDPEVSEYVRDHVLYHRLASVEEPIKATKDVPYFWHIHKSGGSTLKHLMTCLERVQTRRMSEKDCNDNEENLHLCKYDWGTIINADASSPKGIERIVKLGLLEQDIPGLVINTSRIFEALSILNGDKRGRLFVVLRHPIERAVSKFHYTKIATWERNYKPWVKNMTMTEFANSRFCYDNWVTRRLVHKMRPGSELTRNDLAIAKEVLRQKAFILMTNDMAASTDRLIRYFGWPNGDYQKWCVKKYAEDEPVNTNPHELPPRDSEDWRVIEEKNQFDLELYEYAQQLYEQQGIWLEQNRPIE